MDWLLSFVWGFGFLAVCISFPLCWLQNQREERQLKERLSRKPEYASTFIKLNGEGE